MSPGDLQRVVAKLLGAKVVESGSEMGLSGSIESTLDGYNHRHGQVTFYLSNCVYYDATGNVLSKKDKSTVVCDINTIVNNSDANHTSLYIDFLGVTIGD